RGSVSEPNGTVGCSVEIGGSDRPWEAVFISHVANPAVRDDCKRAHSGPVFRRTRPNATFSPEKSTAIAKTSSN
ncbi:MAG: hypothetical protein V5A22_10605, partial [Salinivenus sp.]